MRRVAAVVLVACSGAPATTISPASPPVVAASSPAEPDPVCEAIAHPTPKQAEPEPADDNEPQPAPAKKRDVKVDACAISGTSYTRDEDAILTASRGGAVSRATWDHKRTPEHLDVIRRRFELDKTDLAALDNTGVVVPARLEMPTYTHAYHEIFQSQLPVMITADSIFHAIYASHDTLVAQLEDSDLAPALAGALDAMHCALPGAAAEYPPEVARDLDLYLVVARSLAGGTDVKAKLDRGIDREAAALLASARAGAALENVQLFGRLRAIDFTQYMPRGHYTESDGLKHYFQAAMWASRLEFNLVSRSSRSSAPGWTPDPSETPREALDALALADLAAKSGATKQIDTIDRAWAVLAGRREDVTIAQLAELRAKAGIASLKDPHAFDALKRAIGGGFRRTTRVHPMPEGSTELPAIATLIGPRIVTDAQTLMPLVHSAVPDRLTVGVADVAYAMGLDRAKHYLATDIAEFPVLDHQLDVARKLVASASTGDDLYSAWFAAVRALAKTPDGGPAYTLTDVGRDLRLNTIAAAYGQLKHNYVLMAGQPYAEFGCAIPDGFVEPVPAAYDALIAYTERGAKMMQIVEPNNAHATDHFARVGKILRVLRAIADDELAGRPLTDTEKHWLGQVAELTLDYSVDTTGHPPVYSGWYFDLFYDREGDGMRGAGFIADYLTSATTIAYAGAAAPRMGVFVVDTGGPIRAFAGPVARAYEYHGPLATRLTDQTAAELTKLEEPWAQSYTVAAPPSPVALAAELDGTAIAITSDRDRGVGTFKILDHHRVPIATKRQAIKAGKTVVTFRTKREIDGIYVDVGGFRDFVVADAYGQIAKAWGKPAAHE